MAKNESKKHKEPEHHGEEKPVEAAAESHEHESASETQAPTSESSSKKHPLKKAWEWALMHKKISIPVTAVVVLALLTAIPFTRYALAGLVVKQTFPVVVVDAETGKPVSSATINLGGQTAQTDNEGNASIRAKVGSKELQVTKNYYESFSKKVVVPIGKPKTSYTVELKAIGRAVPVTVVNKISKKAVANATIAAEGTEAQTDSDGKAVLVVPADKQEIAVTISGEGFNAVPGTVTVSVEELPANTFELTPSGKIYFLSNATGKIDVIKSNLDGTDRQTVLAGTGKEDKYGTILFASRDWKYIALLSKRDGGDYAKLFLIEADGDKLTTMDEGEANFDIRGWSGDRLVYKVTRSNVKSWEPKSQTIKSYHVPTKKITALADTSAQGDQNSYAYEYFDSVNVLDQKIVYAITWYSGRYSNYYPDLINGKKASINSVQADGSQKKTVKSYDFPYIDTRTADFGEIYILIQDSEKGRVEEYHNDKVEATSVTRDEYYNESYPTYTVSPSGNKTLWSDYRDGKYIVFVGDGSGDNGKEIGRTDEYSIYGWFTDDYILLTKKDSEMYILPADGLDGGIEKSSKITDYYKPNYGNRGFGYGYGG